MGRIRENKGCLTRLWESAQPNNTNERTQTGGNTAGRNQATMDYFDEQQRQCEAHRARQLEIDATEARRLEQVRAAKERGELYDWQAWDANKTVHATVLVVIGQQIMLGVPQ